MWHKCKIKTQEIYKWKACLNVHGGQQEYCIHNWETYAPVVTWQTVRIFMIISLIQGWAGRQLEFVMAYPQAPAERSLYMHLPRGFQCEAISKDTYVLKLVCNIYGQKQAGHV